MIASLPTTAESTAHMFPPALAPLARQRLEPQCPCIGEVDDAALVNLLTSVFFAGLESYEGEYNPIGVAFIGSSTADFIMANGADAGSLPLYRWKILRFASPRALAVRELVNLAVAGAGGRIHSAVGVLPDGALAIVGLAREGVNAGADDDPFVKILSPKPGCISIYRGHERIVEYERGAVVALTGDEVFSTGPVRRALTTAANRAGVDDEVVPHYVHAVDVLVRELASHGRGGILIVSAEERPAVAEAVPYRMLLDSSLASLLRLGWRVNPGARAESGEAYRQLLRGAFAAEAERVIEELGHLTAIDGAVLLNRDLALIAFGVILPVGPQVLMVDDHGRGVDFGTRGTRHRAAVTYAAEHPGSVVFIASADGEVSCMLRERADAPVCLWRLATGAG